MPGVIIPSHPLTNFKIQKYYQIEPNFNGFYLRKIKDGVYVKNVDEYESLETHWIALYVNRNLTMQCILIGLELKIFQKKVKSSRETKVY